VVEESKHHTKIIEKSDLHIKVLLEGYPLPFVNAIRRICIAEVPTMAVDYVYFLENTSPLYDEIIAHRLGLIPLTSDEALEKYGKPEECAEREDKPNCYAKLYLEVKANKEPIVIYSKDLISDDLDVVPVQKNIPIVMLGPGQKISLEARARLGRGKEHAKWSPTSVAVHKYIPIIEHRKNLCKGTECRICIEVCPKKVLEFRDDKIVLTNPLKCNLCRECIMKCPTNALKISWYNDKFLLYIESTGALKPERILIEASKILEEKAQKLLSDIEKALGERG